MGWMKVDENLIGVVRKMCHKNLGIRLGALFAGISILCGIVVYSAPGAANAILETLTHSSWEYAVKPFEPFSFVLGAVLWFAIGLGIGTLLSCGHEECCMEDGKRRKGKRQASR